MLVGIFIIMFDQPFHHRDGKRIKIKDDRCRDIQIDMGGINHDAAFGPEFGDQTRQFGTAFAIKANGRLVEQPKVALAQQDTGKGGAAFLTT